MDRKQIEQMYTRGVKAYVEESHKFALALFDRLDELSPGIQSVACMRGRCLDKLGRAEEARGIFLTLQRKYGAGPWTGPLERLNQSSGPDAKKAGPDPGQADLSDVTTSLDLRSRSAPLGAGATDARPSLESTAISETSAGHSKSGIIPLGLVNAKETLDAFEAMREHELSIGRLYQAAALAWPEDSEMWTRVANQERLHAVTLRTLATKIELSPHYFEDNRPVNIEAIRRSIALVDQLSVSLMKGAMQRKDFMKAALQIECTIIEKEFTGIVKTPHGPYQAMLNAIETQTTEHIQLIRQQIQLIRTSSLPVSDYT